jgi:hypothetical protein
MEYMQVFRKCSSRIVSSFYYNLFHSLEARRAKERNKFSNFLSVQLGVPYEKVSECLLDEECVKNSKRYKRYSDGANIMVEYTGGVNPKHYLKNSNNQFSTAVHNLFIEYTTFGIAEKLAEYIEMLECVYPTIFKGAVKLYTKNKVTENAHPVNNATQKEVFLRVAEKTCQQLGGDMKLYNEHVLPTFDLRYQYMKQHKDICCRTSITKK